VTPPPQSLDLNFIVKLACKCGPPPDACLQDEEQVTQLSDAGGATFRDAPRAHLERGLSVIRGKIEVEEAEMLVRVRPTSTDNRVRYASVGVIRAAGFAVVHTPSRTNPTHVSVVWPGDDWRTQQVIPWSPEVMLKFAACFGSS
jgi:hypothetical protein